MHIDTRSLLAAVGPVALAGADRRAAIQAIIALDRTFHGMGLKIRVAEDLVEFGRLLQSVGKFLPNAFHPHLKPCRPGDGLAFIAEDADGPMATVGIRLYRFATTTLADHLATLSLFYANPAEQMERGERLVIEGEAEELAMRIDDTAFWEGGMWVRPGARRHGSDLPRLMGYLANTVALARWGRQTAFSIMEIRHKDARHAMEAARRLYDVEVAVPSIRWRRPRKPQRQDMLLVASGADYIIGQMNTLANDAFRAEMPLAEMPLVKTSLAETSLTRAPAAYADAGAVR